MQKNTNNSNLTHVRFSMDLNENLKGESHNILKENLNGDSFFMSILIKFSRDYPEIHKRMS